MKACALFLVFCLLAPGTSLADDEEFYIVTDAPVAVGGGMVRHYVSSDGGRVSTRYSYGGSEGDTIYVEKFATSSKDGSEEREILELKLGKPEKTNSCRLKVGSHTLILKRRRDGRLSVQEIKN